MSRLIDADKLIEELKNLAKGQISSCPNIAEFFVSIRVDRIIDILNSQPTAFDVEQLEEFKEYKENKHRSLRYMYEKGYNKGIDDLTEKIVGYGTYDYYGNVIDVLEIAEKLKEHRDMNIVHCKDCKHWGTGVAGETENIKCCEYGKYMVEKHGFCCYAEKECEE